jgi:septin family protein
VSRSLTDKTIILGLYVDDILLASNDEELLKQTKNLLMETYKMKDLGKVKKFLGLNIKQSEDHTIIL